jgi:flagellar protein FlgJ
VDLATAERLTSTADPKGLSLLKKQAGDPAAAKAVAGQFGALLMQGVMRGIDGAAMAMAGDGVGSNVVSTLFADTIGRAAMSGDKLGLADILFRSIEKKQLAAADGSQSEAATQQAQPAGAAPPAAPPSADGFPLAPYWQGSGVRPISYKAARGSLDRAGVASAGRAGMVASIGEQPPALGWTASASVAGVEPDGSKTASREQVQSFSRRLGPLLQEAGRQLGVSPRILLAQAALETGWGRSVVGNNVFGIKAGPSWHGASITTPTHEVEAGQLVSRQASFRAYPSLDAAVQDYVTLIGSSARYESVVGMGNDAAGYARGLLAGGYATDTEYAHKLEAIAAGPSAAAAFAPPDQLVPAGLFAGGG